MPGSEVNIRPLKEDDLKRVRFLLGFGIMEQLGTINNRAYTHPITISIWLGLTSVFITYMQWWPSDQGNSGLLRYMRPLPAFAAVAVPMMFFFDWFQRDYFEEAAQKAIKGPDMIMPITHYNQSPASGFLVLGDEQNIFGFVAIDASTPSTTTKNGAKLKKNSTTTTNEVAIIRHFFLLDMYRSTGIQEDLVKLAVSRAFTAKSAPLPSKVRIVDSDLQRYKKKAMAAAGFHRVREWDGEGPEEWSTGIFRRKFRWLEITREEWEARQKEGEKDE